MTCTVLFGFPGLPDGLAGLDCNRCTLTYFCVSGLVISVFRLFCGCVCD